MVKYSKSIIGKKIRFGVMVILFVVLEKQIQKRLENILKNKVSCIKDLFANSFNAISMFASSHLKSL